MRLDQVNSGITKHKKKKRVGRGKGSGHGKTSGRGHKGQGALAGWSAHPAFEGGQLPIYRRVPKRGFHNRFADVVRGVNVGTLDELFQDGEEVTMAALSAKNVIRGKYDELKILGTGTLTKKLKISAHRFSATALEKIQQAGAEAVVLPGKAPVVKNKVGTAKKNAIAAKKNKKK
jgi:large subunit ribosomal protein L15